MYNGGIYVARRDTNLADPRCRIESYVVDVLLLQALVTAISSASFVRSNLEPKYSRFCVSIHRIEFYFTSLCEEAATGARH